MLKFAVVVLLFAILAAARSPQHRVVNGRQIGDVVDGQVLNPGTFPYISYIRTRKWIRFRVNATHIAEKIFSGRCAGTIIRENAVLTAAHCVSGVRPENVTLVAGIVTLGVFEQTSQTRFGRRIVANDQYNGTWEYDLAIVFVSVKFNFNKFVNMLTLAKPSDYTIGMTATASGWGRNVNGTLTTWLNAAEMTLVDNSVCKKYSKQDFSSLICAIDSAQTAKVCSGDSGGPLVKNNILVGVLNGGIDIVYPGKPSNGSCSPKYPTAYTKVANYWSWITTQLLWDTSYQNNALIVSKKIQ